MEEIESGVTQRSVLAPIMYFSTVYVNDMNKGVSSYISLLIDEITKTGKKPQGLRVAKE